jgi:hypothetical protein
MKQRDHIPIAHPLDRTAGRGPATPYKDHPAGIEQIVAAWNQAIPTRKVRTVNIYRARDLASLMVSFTPDQIIAVIRWYAGRTWNRERRAWQHFDRFIDEQAFTRKFEDHANELERRAGLESSKSDRVNEISDQLAEAMAAKQDAKARRDRFEALPQARQDELLRRAAEEAVLKGVKRQFISRKTCIPRAIQLMEAEDA